MGQLIDGVWSDDDLISEIKADGAYQKKDAIFRDAITADGSSGFKAETGRYVLYSSVACPWAQRTLLFRALKKLEGIVELYDTVQNPTRKGGWWFGGEEHRVPGTDTSVQYLHEIYTLANGDYSGRVSVPALWDREKRTIVSNESSEIIRMFNSEFADLAEPTPDFYPEPLRPKIEEMNALVLKGVNDAVNGCGRSKSQQAYEASFEVLFDTLDKLDDLLSGQRYLCGNQQTEADWRLFPTLIRFDAIHYLGYLCNKRRIEDYPNLSAFTRDLYQTPGIAGTVDIDLMKKLVYGPGGPVTSTGIIPKGPEVDFNRPHGREKM